MHRSRRWMADAAPAARPTLRPSSNPNLWDGGWDPKCGGDDGIGHGAVNGRCTVVSAAPNVRTARGRGAAPGATTVALSVLSFRRAGGGVLAARGVSEAAWTNHPVSPRPPRPPPPCSPPLVGGADAPLNGLMVSFLAGWPAVARLSARLPARAAKADVDASASMAPTTGAPICH
jgi:hypothetical protein